MDVKNEQPKGLYEKLLAVQRAVQAVLKDGENQSDKYKYVSGDALLSVIRPQMDALGLLLVPSVRNHSLIEGQTRSGTARFFTEIELDFTWLDVESGEDLRIPWYGQGTDLGGERGIGKAYTYAEKYFLLKFFHVPTDKDDPDNDGRTKTGEKKQAGTAAAKETAAMQRAAVEQMLAELYGDDAEKKRIAIVALTRNEKRGYAGAETVEAVSDAAMPLLYAKIKKGYESRVGKPFVLNGGENNADA